MIGVRNGLVALPGTHGNASVADISRQGTVRSEYAGAQFVCKDPSTHNNQVKNKGPVDAVGSRIFANLDGPFLILCQAGISPDAEIDAVRGNRERSRGTERLGRQKHCCHSHWIFTVVIFVTLPSATT